MTPGLGWKPRAGSSALMRTSMACPCGSRSRSSTFSPAATRICSFTRSVRVMSSVTGCSTWIRQFTSMK